MAIIPRELSLNSDLFKRPTERDFRLSILGLLLFAAGSWGDPPQSSSA
jgi:hypothetical protein